MSLKPSVSDPNRISENEATCGESDPDLDVSDVTLTPDNVIIEETTPEERTSLVSEPPLPYTFDPDLDKQLQIHPIIEYHELTDRPMELQCYRCLFDITTRTEYHYSNGTWMTMGVLFLLGLWPCIPIPLCIKSLMDVTHYCPNCRTYLGMYYRF